jgi:glutaminyl-peptide cyclotransferase
LRNNRLPHWLLVPVLVFTAIALPLVSLVSCSAQPPNSSLPLSPTQFSTPTSLSTARSTSPVANILPATPTTAVATSTSTPVSPIPTPTTASDLTFDGNMAYEHVLAQVQIGPRPVGSEAGWATGEFIISELNKAGWPIQTQEFIFQGVKGRNIIGKMGSGPIIILGAHYDTRPAADQDPDPALRNEWIEGANDGASGVGVLLELARVIETGKLKNEVWLAFFDAEDRGRLDGWPFSVGARHMAENLGVNPQSVVVIDMIGDADQNIFFEHNSTESLRNEVWAVAAELGYEAYIIPELRHTIIDDHLPFLERGIPAIDMIDFDYPYWHTVADTADKVTPASLERVGRTLEVWLEEKQ